MSRDIGTTPRKPLTPTQRLKLFEDHKGICILCTHPIRSGEAWRDEHLRALGLGGGNEWENRAPVHIKCAEAKDKDDLSRIAKAKAQKRASLNIRTAAHKPIQSPPFPEREKRHVSATKVVPRNSSTFNGMRLKP